MFDLLKTKREFYESQSKEQLIIFLLNDDMKKELLMKKLQILTGCGSFGDCDGTNGSCVDCYYENPTLNMQCSKFQEKYIRKLKEEVKQKSK